MASDSVYSGTQGPQGDQGIQGDTGPTGPTGPGVPNGGSTGQVLEKVSNTDQDTQWATPSTSIFGTEFQKAESLAESQTPLTSYQQKLRMTTTNLPAGDYMVFWSADVGNAISDREFAAQFEQDDATQLGELGFKAKITTAPTANVDASFSGHAVRTLSGVHTFDIDYAAGSGTATIKNARITLWRVS